MSRLAAVFLLVCLSAPCLSAQSGGDIPKLPTLENPELAVPDEGGDGDDPFDESDEFDLPDPEAVSREARARDSDLAFEAEAADDLLDRHTPMNSWERYLIIFAILGTGLVGLIVWYLRSLRGEESAR